jgi:PAS domain S-box-containing protein
MTSEDPRHSLAATPDEHAACLRALEAATLGLGSKPSVRQALRTAVDLMLHSPIPGWMAVGEDSILLHNAAFGRLLGPAQSAALGKPCREVLADSWSVLGPAIEAAMRGEPQSLRDVQDTTLGRDDGASRWFDHAFVPIRDETGQSLGVFCQAIETTEKIRTLAALDDSDKRFRAVLTNSSDVVYRMSPDWSEMRLLEGRNFIADTSQPSQGWLETYIPEGDRADVLRAIHKAIEGQQPFELEHRVRRIDGSIGWTMSRAIPLLDPEGRIVEWFGAASDVTRRKEAEEELARQRRLYEAILNNTPDLAYIFDREHRFIYANEGLLKMWGKTWDEACGKTCLELGYEPWHAAMHNREIDQVVCTGEAVRGEVPFTGTFGRRVYDYIMVPVFGDSGEVEAVAGTTRDVTEGHEIADTLRLHVERFQTLLNQAPLGVYVVDANFRICNVNPVAMPVFRSVPGGVLGRNLEEVLHALWEDDLAREAVSIFRHTLETGESYVAAEREAVRVDRAAKQYFEWRVDRITLPDGQYGAVCYFRDISEQVSTRKAIEESREALREADRRKDEFLATLAHELRNPLAPIRSGLEVLRLTEPGSEVQEEVRGLMERQVQLMTRLIDDLLDVSRITRGKLQLRLSRVSLADIVQSSVEAIGPLMRQADHTLHVDMPAEALLVEVDPSRMAQVISNLLGNAAKYTPSGGQVRLSAVRDGTDVVLTVADNGIGIARDMQQRIFEMFAQVDTSLEKEHAGLGIGLTLVKSLVELHGGSVWVESEGPGQGSRFRVRLPLAKPASNDPQSTGRQPGGEASGFRVLVVDDNLAGAKILSLMVKALGNTVCTAHDGQEALDRAAEFRPDIVIMDIGMPRMNGYDAARAMRGQSWGRDLPLVALTGWGQEEDRRQTRAAGFNRHLVKPVEPAVLAEIFADLRNTVDSTGQQAT